MQFPFLHPHTIYDLIIDNRLIESNANMSASELEIYAFLNLLIPTTSTDPDCPICHEPYPEYDSDRVRDYPAWPMDRREGAQCRHVFGRICIEQHVRGGYEYSTRCPICREVWIGNGVERQDLEARLRDVREELTELIRRHSGLRRLAGDTLEDTASGADEVFELEGSAPAPTNIQTQQQTHRLHSPTLYGRRGAIEITPPESDDEREVLAVPEGVVVPEGRRYPIAPRRVDRIVGRLERVRSIYLLQNPTASESLALMAIEDAVVELWQRLAERTRLSARE